MIEVPPEQFTAEGTLGAYVQGFATIADVRGAIKKLGNELRCARRALDSALTDMAGKDHEIAELKAEIARLKGGRWW